MALSMTGCMTVTGDDSQTVEEQPKLSAAEPDDTPDVDSRTPPATT